jgi:hypothetical protein
MPQPLLHLYVRIRNLPVGLVKDESGEGVISAAIAVLIMASLGALMWVGFKAIWGDVETNTQNQVQEIGGGAG